MQWFKNQSRQENVIYLVVWGMLFAAPLLSMLVRSMGGQGVAFNWNEVFFVWKHFSIFLLLFLIHNFFLAPLLVHHNRRVLYISLVVLAVGAFAVYQCSSRPAHIPPPMEHTEGGPGRLHMPPPIIGEHDVLKIVLLVLIFGANLGVKYYYRSRHDHKKLLELEKQHLEQQLEYLRYQINPHFFMNTLNNIHALVDIDPQKAQATILELSKMMRFVLYEGDKSGVSLSREFDFLRTYIHLMQLRYTDKVKISIDLPSEVPDKTIPPLIFISFIENAFKHGVSYQHDSFITVRAEVTKDRLHFLCCNSKADKPNEEKGGVGLVNVQRRLDLLYDSRYTLKIDDGESTYTVDLTLPLS